MKFKTKTILIASIVAMLLLSFSMVTAANNTSNNGTDEELKPITIPPEKNAPVKDSSSSTKTVAMKATGVPIALGVLSLIVSVGLLVRREQ